MFQFGASPMEDEAIPRTTGSSTGNLLKTVKRQITRNRASYSCGTCRRRKVKCDKVHPTCGGCRKTNEQCLYGPDDASSKSVPPSLIDRQSSFEAKKRKISLSTPSPSDSPSVPTPSDSASSGPLKAIQEQLHRLTTMIDAMRQEGDTTLQLQLQELLAPKSSSSDQGPFQRRGLNLDTFQTKGNRIPGDTNDLSRLLSGLQLNNKPRRPEDPLWDHISEELEQLNQRMHDQRGGYACPTGIRDKQCPGTGTGISDGHHAAEKEDFWEPTSFRKEAGQEFPHCYSLDSSCPICQIMPFTKSTLLQGISVRCTPESAKHHLLKNIPTKAQSNVLLRCWLSGVYPIMPILNPAELVEKSEAFWTRLQTSRFSYLDYPELDILTLLYAIWYAASLSISLKGLQRWFPDTTRAKLASGFHDQVVLCLHVGSFTRNMTLQKLAAIICIVSLPSAEEEPVQASLYMQLAVRLATMMALHREPTLLDVSRSEEEFRRRLWSQIVQMDVSLVVIAGFPSLISEVFCDTGLIYENPKAADVDGTEGAHGRATELSGFESTGDARISSQRTLKLVAQARSVMASTLRTVVSIHLGTKTLTTADMHEMKRVIQDCGEEVDAIIQQIPAKGLPEMGFVPDGPKAGQQRVLDCDQFMTTSLSPKEVDFYMTSTSYEELSPPLARYYRPKLAAYNKWARITLSLLKDKLHCFAYAPFLKNAKSKLWGVGRQCALHICHSFMRKFISLATDPDLEPFRWTWPSMHGPLHAVMIALVDVYERPNSIEAPRTRELVDGIFSLSDPQSGIVGGPNGVSAQRPLREGGLEAWDMLRGLRSVAWQNAGLDPTVLWTEDDQVQVGLATPLTDTQKVARSLREDALYDRDWCSKERQKMKDDMSEIKTAENGAPYMVRLAHAGAETLEGFSCIRGLRNQFLENIENDPFLGRNRGLARRRGQPAMPFPLPGRLAQSSQKAADADTGLDRVLQVNGDVIRTESHPGDLLYPPTENGAAHQGQTGPPDRTGEQVSPGSNEVPGLTGYRHGEPHPQLAQTEAQGLASPRTGSIGDRIHQHQHHQASDVQHNPNGLNSGLHQDSLADTKGDLGFDWERWDAVFGQYSAFTDLMEDVIWEDYADE